MKKTIVLILIFAVNLAFGQDSLYKQTDSVLSFSLEQAQEYALKHNIQIINSKLDVKKAKWQIWQTTAIGLPQVNAQVDYKQYPSLPTQLMPNFLSPVIYEINMRDFGLQPIAPPPSPNEKIPVHFGSKYNGGWGVTVSQLIFNGQYFIGLEAAKIFKQLSEQNEQKTERDLKASIEQSYVLLLIAQKSVQVIEQTLQNNQALLQKTQQLVTSGMAQSTQVDQMKYMIFTLENELKMLKRQEKLAQRLLKFQLGLSFNDSIVLTTSLDQILNKLRLGDYLNPGYSPEHDIDYKIILTREQLAKLDLRREEAKLLPVVTGFYSYSKNAMRDEFDFFDSGKPWFKTALFGIQIKIPLWGSGAKIASIEQKKIDYLKIQNTRQMMEQQLNIKYLQTRDNFINAFERMLNAKQNISLTKKIYQDTKQKYLAGAASSLELTQAQNQYLKAVGNYYSSLMDLIKAKSELEKLIQQ